ncbi:chaperonin 10-like protein [Thelonectria olida]|uniref:Chaperonin 10-like protein n=1 Tax=Thelonectria olida TaxID=1576542 RepID=A0A9P9ALZ5_9HYPO|nr:chaperonin 10-like protein [Thelonectria olida]
MSVVYRSTPEPGPNEILIRVKAVALNPVDYVQRDLGMPPVPSYPAVVGSDVAGFVAKVGSGVSNAPPLGNRVIAFASSFYQNGSPDHVGRRHCPPEALSFEQGAVLPLAALTALSGWTTIGIPLDTRLTSEDKQAVLIWGGASSSLGFTVYAAASVKNHEYLKQLGEDVVFDCGERDVVSQIVDKAQKDGVTLHMAYCVVEGSLQPTLDVLKNIKGGSIVKVAYAPPLRPGAPSLEGLRSVVPSPRIQVEAGGLEGLNEALGKLKAGVSGTKIVAPI